MAGMARGGGRVGLARRPLVATRARGGAPSWQPLEHPPRAEPSTRTPPPTTTPPTVRNLADILEQRAVLYLNKLYLNEVKNLSIVIICCIHPTGHLKLVCRPNYIDVYCQKYLMII